jgi:ribosomal protein S18 acetylase RimI-like enzyme
MNNTFSAEPRLATIDDLQTIINMVKDAADWLQTKGTDQWAKPWPSCTERDERIRHGLATNSTWIIWDGSTAVATLTAHRDGLEQLWTPEERREPAVYVHRVIVNREYAGRQVGAQLIDWASLRAAREYGARQTRIDVWTTNDALHDYYRRIGFTFIRFAESHATYPSRALFRRPIEAISRSGPYRADA